MDINKRPQRKKTLPVKLQDSKETSGLKRPAKSKRVAKIAKLNDGPLVYINWLNRHMKKVHRRNQNLTNDCMIM